FLPLPRDPRRRLLSRCRRARASPRPHWPPATSNPCSPPRRHSHLELEQRSGSAGQGGNSQPRLVRVAWWPRCGRPVLCLHERGLDPDSAEGGEQQPAMLCWPWRRKELMWLGFGYPRHPSPRSLSAWPWSEGGRRDAAKSSDAGCNSLNRWRSRPRERERRPSAPAPLSLPLLWRCFAGDI
uniref:Uncharacterized protein n=1 Tax=Triticum urartu TaxID=4572 RepID=A0A8R7R8K6_TRIUA